MSSSQSPFDRREMARLGANAYFHKPLSYDEFLQIGEVMKGLLAGERPQVW